MATHIPTSIRILTAAILMFEAFAVLASDLSTLPQPQQEGSVTYITGGIGDEERDALRAVSRDYNLHVMSASTSGAFAGQTQIIIRSRQGEEVVDESDAG